MSEIVDRVFPPEQCLSEEMMQLVETELEVRDINQFFEIYGPRDKIAKGTPHIQDPFTCTYTHLQEMNIFFRGSRVCGDKFLHLVKEEVWAKS